MEIDMEHFLDTSGTIESGYGFSHFGPLHIGWLIAFVIISAGVCLLYKKCGTVGRKRMRITLASLVVLDEIFKIVMLAIEGNYSKDYLPLHLCSINIILIAIHAIKPSKLLGNFLYSFCMPAAALALLFPTWTKLPFANFMHLHSFTVHILLCLYPLTLTVAGEIKPRVKDLWKSLLSLVCLAIPVYIFNLVFDTNYMFLMSAEEGNPLYLFEQLCGNHLIGIPIILVPLMAVLYTPWEIVACVKRSLPTLKESKKYVKVRKSSPFSE